MKNIRVIIIGILFIIAVIAIVFVLKKMNFLWSKEPLKIDKTANVVTEIKKISEFSTACFYEEIILSDKKTNALLDNKVGQTISDILGKKEVLIEDEIVIIAKGKVRAGFDLSQLKNDDILVFSDTITIRLPQAQLFDVIINPSGFEIYVEDGSWTHEQVTALEKKAKAILEKDALDFGILEKASQFGVKKLENLLKALGFKIVIIEFEIVEK